MKVLTNQCFLTTAVLILTINFQLAFAQNNSVIIDQLGTVPNLGGSVLLYDNDGTSLNASLAPANNNGGKLELFDRNGEVYFEIDGSVSSGNTLFRLADWPYQINLQTWSIGDDAVKLPDNSINAATEGFNLSKVSNALDWIQSVPSSTGEILSQDIICPSAGYVLVVASGEVEMQKSLPIAQRIELGVSDTNNSLSSAQRISIEIPSNADNGTWTQSFLVQGLFEVSGPGTETFYLNGNEVSGSVTQILRTNLSLVFFPTNYGSVTSNIADTIDEESIK